MEETLEHDCGRTEEFYGVYYQDNPSWTNGWHIDIDSEYAVPIDYCPYCGEKLPMPEQQGVVAP
jgi:hypothetical protein